MKYPSSPPLRLFALLAAAALTLSACGGAAGEETDVVTLDFFQFKSEAVGNFTEIIAGFEAENPDIRVVQNHVPDADTAIRTLLVKDKTPDVLTLNVSGYFGQLAKACVFADLSDQPALQTVRPVVQEIVADLGTCDGEVNALPFSSNASGILYNKDLFAQFDVQVPTTWDELIAAAETFKANGVTPFYTTPKDAWTVGPAFVNIGGALAPEGFFDDLRSAGEDLDSSPVTFTKDYVEAAAKVKTLFSYSQPNAASADYETGNAAFAAGQSAMYLQGSHAIPPIKAANPEVNVGSFAYPVGDDPQENVVVSGVDVGISVGRDTKHPEEARRFVEYLMSPRVVADYAASQSAFSPLVDSPDVTDPALQGIAGYYKDGRIIGFIDHQIPPSIPLVQSLQTLVLGGTPEGFTSRLDNEWSKVAARTIPHDKDQK